MTLFTIMLSIVVLVVALYALRILNTPYLGAFRFALYLLLVLLALSVWYGMKDHPYEGYDPTVDANREP
ncbi:MAG TPA: hypothetical protein VFS39_12655 [Nitrospira sp.]|nr:hypothetical protein [Nitrospira sp.]